ncbi:MAG: cell division protein CrgA [Bifidobacteriaceae bacterium]|nr:cell division protein CrgA [Bifidobacteriaceae bacterium]
MPESRSRRKNKQVYTPPPVSKDAKPSPTWWAPVMVGVMLLGLVWVVVYYLSQGSFPISQLGAWNLGIGFGLILGGFGMTAGWR